MPPHEFIGYTLGEWFTLLSIAAMFIAIISWFVRKIILDPIRRDMKEGNLESKANNIALMSTIDVLSKKVENIGGNADIIHERQDKRLDAHDQTLTQHTEQIKTLYELEKGNYQSENKLERKIKK